MIAEERSREEQHRERAVSESDQWRNFHEKFQALANEELKEGAPQSDRFVRAYFTYRKGAEILQVLRDARWALALFSDSGKPATEPKMPNTGLSAYGPFCLVETPECGLWSLSGGVSENFSERAQTLGARAGVALGCPTGADPLDSWLHRLLYDLRENRSKVLVADNGEDGIIARVCEASAIFCSRLERRALGASLLINRQDGKHRKPGLGDPEVAKRRSLVRSNPNTAAHELCAILDRNGVRVPFKWQDAGFNEWTKAYKNPEYRSRIDVLVSKDRTSG
jgi:hypothetical protein